MLHAQIFLFLEYSRILMPSLHLLRSSYDGLVYDFPCDFWGIVGGSGLRCLRYIIYGHGAISCIGHHRGAKDKAVQRLYGDCTWVVGRSCDFCAVTVTYSRKSYIDRAISVQRLCEDRKVKVSSLNATYDVFNGYDLTIWKICITPR